jgi:flagellum-specific peptidoglycan hydrolase FlgJ
MKNIIYLLLIFMICFLFFIQYDANITSEKQPEEIEKTILEDSVIIDTTKQKDSVKLYETSVKKSLTELAFERYIKRFSHIAIQEQTKYGIPASITLAQGLLESAAGQSTMAIKDNNHFGIKCTNKCLGCRCANYSDDDIYDMFRIFETAWESYREHSKILLNDRYKSCFKSKSYKHWAKELQRCGYATSKRYAKNLINIIEKYKLHKYDR